MRAVQGNRNFRKKALKFPLRAQKGSSHQTEEQMDLHEGGGGLTGAQVNEEIGTGWRWGRSKIQLGRN